jgi:glycosyltransferase involved in cell wall biosynthesis
MIAGIDARAATEEGAGAGRVVRELLAALATRDDDHRYCLYAHRRWEEPLDERFEWRLLPWPVPLWNLLAARAASHECSAVLTMNSYPTAWFTWVPAVPMIFDLTTFDRAMRPNRRSAVIERLTLGMAVRRAAALLAISKATADDLVARFPKANEKVRVVPLGVGREFHAEAARSDAADGFVLAVGTLEPRKNLPRLVLAYSALDRDLQERHPLVVVGRHGWQAGETLHALRSLGDRCRVRGYVSDAELAGLYRRCAVFCYPSLGEGFGLPVLEAMAAGAPVVTSDRSSLPEVGGDAVEYVDPTDVRSIAAGLRRILESPARAAELRERGKRKAAEFSWGRTAEVVVSTLQGVARPRSSGWR